MNAFLIGKDKEFLLLDCLSFTESVKFRQPKRGKGREGKEAIGFTSHLRLPEIGALCNPSLF